MKPEDLELLIKRVTESKNCNVTFNQPVNNSYNNARPVVIHECNATLTSTLIKDGFSLFVSGGCVIPDKF